MRRLIEMLFHRDPQPHERTENAARVERLQRESDEVLARVAELDPQRAKTFADGRLGSYGRVRLTR